MSELRDVRNSPNLIKSSNFSQGDILIVQKNGPARSFKEKSKETLKSDIHSFVRRIKLRCSCVMIFVVQSVNKGILRRQIIVSALSAQSTVPEDDVAVYVPPRTCHR